MAQKLYVLKMPAYRKMIMIFAEVLPPQCPPQGASDVSIEKAYRAVTSMTPQASDFASHAALKRPIGNGVDPCRHASCSLFLSKDACLMIHPVLEVKGTAAMRIASSLQWQGMGRKLAGFGTVLEFGHPCLLSSS